MDMVALLFLAGQPGASCRPGRSVALIVGAADTVKCVDEGEFF